MAVPQTKSIVSVSRLDTCFDVSKNSLLFKELAPQSLFSLIVPFHVARGRGPLTVGVNDLSTPFVVVNG